MFLLPQASNDAVAFDNVRTAILITVAPNDHPIKVQARQLRRSPELAEFELVLEALSPNPAPNRISTYVGKFIDTSKPGWALFTPSGKLIASGSAAPTTEQILTALDRANIQAPVKTLRAFLQKHPDHIEARVDLLKLLRKKAVAQTKKALGIDAKSLRERVEDLEINSWTISPYDIPDTSSYDSKKLTSEDDITIWGPYAQELDVFFNDGSWRNILSALYDPDNHVPVEICSQTMHTLYIRHLPKVEEKLAALPGQPQLWGVWNYYVQVTRSNRGAAFANAFPEIPPELRIKWPPPPVINSLAKSAKTSGDWLLIRNLLDSFWREISGRAAVYSHPDPDRHYQYGRNVNWDVNYAPLLESMIRTGATQEAREFVQAIMSKPETSHFKSKCIELAINCERRDLAAEWGQL